MTDTIEPQSVTPIHLLTGFLGSGKTTLLTKLLKHLKSLGLKPAVIMNEIGQVNLDGEMLGPNVPMAEMLSGCICCSIRGDLGVELGALIDQHRPDVILIEATGAANPMETLDGVTDAAMYKAVELRSVITVVDGPELLQRSRNGKGKTFKLMMEQIRCGSMLLLNKSDKLAPEELVEAQQLLRELNVHAAVIPAVRCELEDWSLLNLTQPDFGEALRYNQGIQALPNETVLAQVQEHFHEPAGSPDHRHHSHEHVMVVTHYFDGPIDSGRFEQLLRSLPDNIYRAKGIVSFGDTSEGSRFLFQYAYKESDFIRIEPQGKVNNVAVFIGEHFDKKRLKDELMKLNEAE